MKRILYIQYTIYSRDLLNSDVILAQENDFIIEPISSIEEKSFQFVEDDLNVMKNEMKHFPLEGEETSNQIYDYYRATLASRFHFPFVQYKRPLFHYSNITLVHEDILDVFVKTQKFISEIKMDELRIFAVPYFHSENKDTLKDGNEKSREKYAPDIIGYLIFDKEEKQGIAIILHNESKSDENYVTPHCRTMECDSYHEYLKEKGVDENMFCYAYCCNINSILSEWKLDAPFSRSNQEFDDLNIQV